MMKQSVLEWFPVNLAITVLEKKVNWWSGQIGTLAPFLSTLNVLS